MITITNRWSGKVLLEKNIDSLEGAYLRGADLEGAYLEGANLRGAYLEGANLRGADLRGAYLRGAYLRGAYLRGADLEGADLEGADFRGANLEGAKLDGCYLTIQGSQHCLIYYNGLLQIGCEIHSLDKWLASYEIIGNDNEYTESQIKEYYNYMKICKELS